MEELLATFNLTKKILDIIIKKETTDRSEYYNNFLKYI